MNKNLEIEYKLIARSPILNPIPKDGNYIIPASSIKGAIRQVFNRLNSKTNNRISEDKVFGGRQNDGNFYSSSFYVSDLVCQGVEKNIVIQNLCFAKIKRNKPDIESITHQSALATGSEFLGKIIFNEEPTGFERSVVLSSLLDFQNIGMRNSLGYGSCDIQILNQTNTIVFFSYSWEDTSHMDWVRKLAMKLMANGLDVLLDQLSPSFNVNAPQNEINEWMKQCIQNSDKILAIFTPVYKKKADLGLGGVGYEYMHLQSENELISQKLQRYIGVLRKGNLIESVPIEWKNKPIIEMSRIKEENTFLNELNQVMRAFK